MPPTPSGHTPVLLDAVLAYLDPKPGEVMVDATVGRGGHAEAILPRLGDTGHLIALDVDAANLDFVRSRLGGSKALTLLRGNFRQATQLVRQAGFDRVDGLLADLGFASTQMDDPSRGFSFQKDGPLDMRLDDRLSVTAAELVNGLPTDDLADLIYRYGEERLSRRIARKIDSFRQREPIETTSTLAELVRQAYPPGARGRQARIDPATRTFQALRIAVNGELDALGELLEQLPGLLAPDGRAVIISFHSLEDRMVKQAFAAWEASGNGQRLTRKVVVASEQEIRDNSRSRSAKLRAARSGMIQHDTRNEGRTAGGLRHHSSHRDRGL